jgi:hypothetical protein
MAYRRGGHYSDDCKLCEIVELIVLAPYYVVRNHPLLAPAVAIGFALLILSALYAIARPSAQWNSSSPAVAEWFANLMQPDHPRLSCCGEADAFEADTFEVEGDHYVAIITDGRGVLPTGTRVVVPNSKMKYDAGNPTGHGVIFLGTAIIGSSVREVYCYVAPGGA